MRKRVILIVALTLFVALFPLINRIKFYQNDDWVYYEMVSRFMIGDFTLHPYTGPTFYTQGVIGAGFSHLFGIENLPLLTLLFGVLNFYLLTRFLNERLNVSLKMSLLLGLIFFFNPLSIYLLLGFMTAHYFIFFMLLSVWAYSYWKETEEKKYLYLLITTIFLGLVVRQVSLFIPLGLSLYHFLKLQFKKGGLFLTLFVIFYYYYSNIFPLSPRILEVPLQFHHLSDFDYSFALVFGVLVVLTAYLFPVLLSSFDLKKVIQSKGKLVLAVLLGFGLYTLALNHFNPHEISWGEFPYFENTLERTGLYPRGISGTKYQFKWNYDLYYYWDLTSKILLISLVSYVLLFNRKIVNEYSALAAVYIGMLIVTETFYDRYILILMPLIIMFFAKAFLKDNFIARNLMLGFVLFLVAFSYQMANDFVSVNEYVWNRAESLSLEENLDKKYIQATNAWKLTYRNELRDYIYNFSYDSQSVNEDYANLYTLVEEKEITFPGSIFVNPKIYLYKIN